MFLGLSYQTKESSLTYLSTFRQLKQSLKNHKEYNIEGHLPGTGVSLPVPWRGAQTGDFVFQKLCQVSWHSCSPGKGHKSTSRHTFPIARVIPVECPPRTALNNYRRAFIASHTTPHLRKVTPGTFSKIDQCCQVIPIKKFGWKTC